MIAAHARLDDARAIIDFAARENSQKNVAGVMAGLKAGITYERRSVERGPIVRLSSSRALGSAQMPFNRFAYERANVLFVHK